MQLTNGSYQLHGILKNNLDKDTLNWLQAKLQSILEKASARDLFLTYTLLGNKIKADQSPVFESAGEEIEYLKSHQASTLEIARLYLLSRVLEENPGFFKAKVAQIIQLADTGELVTFLRYLHLLPEAEAFSQVAVEALRTNIATVFDAIALDNPYPSKYFNDQQWNQMYLKAAFMQRDLGSIRDVDERANKDLARIISDYAHERWAASRDVDPSFWRPVGPFLEGVLLEDMRELLNSKNVDEQHAGALCIGKSQNPAANELLQDFPELKAKLENGQLGWNHLNKKS